MTAFTDAWWLPLVVFASLVVLIWCAKKKLGKNPDKRERETIMALGILLMLAGVMYPSAIRKSEQLLTVSRIVLVANVIFIATVSARMIFRKKREPRPPNQAL